ncbi:hypothetical protein IWQ47_003053 [Aquimarina sp. EL_43]|uniref:hypothetical protein n=1 Tax=unclassified Aquimarina TaxID=2627091 RepID=UPI0018C92DA3|nr:MULTISPECIES: hypothetical protein [unclassified Aquimarina]MBG6131627.1 hypothetical protein [Aquimarina sp. EL_35]MBG6152088.1 hypothetical protein [Aquimarina sp. EL_32]MBG6169968.1 hypothetical protein [Aquimarina sp. EL_43]
MSTNAYSDSPHCGTKLTKEELEFEKIKQEIKTIKTNRRLGNFKWISAVIGTIILFFIIQRPESILNRKSSQETINKERASMVLKLIENGSNSKDLLIGLKVIKKSYPESDNKWISDLIDFFETRAHIEDRILKSKLEARILNLQEDSILLANRKRKATTWDELKDIKESTINNNKHMISTKIQLDSLFGLGLKFN